MSDDAMSRRDPLSEEYPSEKARQAYTEAYAKGLSDAMRPDDDWPDVPHVRAGTFAGLRAAYAVDFPALGRSPQPVPCPTCARNAAHLRAMKPSNTFPLSIGFEDDEGGSPQRHDAFCPEVIRANGLCDCGLSPQPPADTPEEFRADPARFWYEDSMRRADRVRELEHELAGPPPAGEDISAIGLLQAKLDGAETYIRLVQYERDQARAALRGGSHQPDNVPFHTHKTGVGGTEMSANVEADVSNLREMVEEAYAALERVAAPTCESAETYASLYYPLLFLAATAKEMLAGPPEPGSEVSPAFIDRMIAEVKQRRGASPQEPGKPQ